jgi:hypothetical protein
VDAIHLSAMMVLMKNLALIVLTTTLFQNFALGSNQQTAKDKCLLTSKYVLFSKAILTIEDKYESYMHQQHKDGHYTDEELKKITKQKVAQIPNHICQDHLSSSLDMFVNTINKNCIQNKKEEVKIYTAEIASDISESLIKNSKESIKKVKQVALKSLESSLKKYNKCNKTDQYARSIASIEMFDRPEVVCTEILKIINQAKDDRSRCL